MIKLTSLLFLFLSTLINSLNISESSGIIKFFPNCFPDDLSTHSFKMDIVIDYGVYRSITDNMVGSDKIQKDKKVIDDFQLSFSVGKLFFLEQLNILLEINNIRIGNNTDVVPLSRSNAKGTCIGATGAFNEFNNWNNIYNSGKSGHTMLISNCFSGVTGVSYVGSICSNSANVAAFSYIVMFHELGHAFGADHTFQNGIGTTGGIMDYGSGIYNGVIQFHPFNRPQLCNTLTYIKNKNCKFFQPVESNSTCGNGILEKNEKCECLDGSDNCLNCVGCKTDVECSSENFIVRYDDTPNITVVDKSLLSDKKCCVNNLVVPRTLCGTDNLNVCGPNGKCLEVCTKYLQWDNPNCGFSDNGCMIGCIWNDKCRWDLTMDDNNVETQISILPNGTKCSNNGKCYGNSCVVYNNSTFSPTTVIKCNSYKKKSKCISKKCKWIRNKCYNK